METMNRVFLAMFDVEKYTLAQMYNNFDRLAKYHMVYYLRLFQELEYNFSATHQNILCGLSSIIAFVIGKSSRLVSF
jgi:hypothetical protein